MHNYKIARISTVPFFIVTQLKGQIEFLSNSGISVTVISSDVSNMSQNSFSGDISYLDVTIDRRPSPIKDLLALIRLILIYRKHRFDIVHSTTPKAGLLSAIAVKFSRVPISLHTFTGQPWVTLTGVLRMISRASDVLIGKLNTHCYADSFSQRNYLIEENIISANKISVIGKGSLAGVDLSRFNQERFSKNERERLKHEIINNQRSIVLTFIGRITKDKGIFELLLAFKLLRESGYIVELMLVGPFDIGKDKKSSELQTYVQNLEKVHWINYTDEPERYLAFTDILCLPSYREGFGTVVIEAAAMGIPTVGTNIPGLSDAIEKDVTGLLVPVTDHEALFKAIKKLLDSPYERKNMGASAKMRCFEKFDAEKVNQEILKEYLRLIGLSKSD